MKLLLDQDVPRRTAALLREAGVDAIHASEAGLSSVAISGRLSGGSQSSLKPRF